MSACPRNKEIPKPVRNDNRAYAFTLAEVLITLVIIGVVATLTIPNLMQKYTEQATVKKVQKFYSTLSNAYNLAMRENGAESEWGLTGTYAENNIKIYEILFKPYFKIAKNCGGNNTGNCFTTNKYKFLNNDEQVAYGANQNYYKITLEDGVSALWIKQGVELAVFIDTNGPKGPNQYGTDFFAFIIKNNNVFPQGLPSGEYRNRPFDSNCKSSGIGCTAWVIYKGNMDYLHCDLTWAKHSCKDK